jgi:hypothetical protein
MGRVAGEMGNDAFVLVKRRPDRSGVKQFARGPCSVSPMAPPRGSSRPAAGGRSMRAHRKIHTFANRLETLDSG